VLGAARPIQSREGRKENSASTQRRAWNFHSPIAKCRSATASEDEGEGLQSRALDARWRTHRHRRAGGQAIAQGAFEQALAYAQQRQAFGHPIADFQAISSCSPTWATEIDAARLLVRKAAWNRTRGALHPGGFELRAVCFGNATRVTHESDADSRRHGYQPRVSGRTHVP